MKLEPLALAGAYLLRWEVHVDERGHFARTWSSDELADAGLDVRVAQCSVSHNRVARTLRGMHLQVGASAETKVVRCSRGAIFDVLVDLRPDSPTYCSWVGVPLDQDEPTSLYVPEGLAHGFLTLRDETEVSYQISLAHDPAASRGVRWDDPAFGIEWPAPPLVLSERDRTQADFVP
ncbi:MAG: dTDP-4-dehydrorhamnose 3,5-epimerase [Actinomycetia bacterium]|nr:dTDP-4-dehydrorhamnose 3,5-epimerase [Actinomycetes bacterium]